MRGFSWPSPCKSPLKRHAGIWAASLVSVVLAGRPSNAATLNNTVRTASELRFTVIGPSNASYIIEGSANLQQWQSVLSSREFGEARTMSVNLTGQRAYYRARLAQSFERAITAQGQVELSGTIEADSFDSANPLYSTSGRYDPTKRRDGGGVATSSGITNSLLVGNARIYGELSVGPGGSAVLGPSGCVGSIAYVSNPGNVGTIQPGWLREEPGPYFHDVTAPFGPALAPAPGIIGGTNYQYVLGNGIYRMAAALTMSGGTMMVTGRASLWVQGNVSISGTAQIVIGPDASLALYVGTATGSGVSASISGNGVINQTTRAVGFQYYGLPRNVAVMFSSHDLVATIYAPNADLTLTAGGSASYDFSGAAVARTVTVNGHYQIHYDEDLARTGPLF
jgi:hypothetical protein